MRECLMSCPSCGSLNQAEFATEMMIHSSGFAHIATPSVLAFPKVSVCLKCGASRFTLPDSELQLLRNGTGASAAA